MAGSHGRAAVPGLEKENQMATEQERNKALVLQMYDEVWNKGNLTFIPQAVSADFIDHPPAGFLHFPAEGLAAIAEAAVTFRKAIPDLHMQMIRAVADADRVVYLGQITGTHTGNFLKFPPTGHKISIMGIYDYRMQGGKIAERWSIFDMMGLMQQVGAMPAGPGGH